MFFVGLDPLFLVSDFCYSEVGNLPLEGVLLVNELISLVIAPLFVGLVIVLVDHWLDD